MMYAELTGARYRVPVLRTIARQDPMAPSPHRQAPISAARLAGLLGLICIAGCSPYRIIDMPSTNQSSRVDYLVIHFTSENFAESYRLLGTRTENPVSAHYLIPTPDDPSYDRRKPLIHRLVPEHRRAWHAGQSYWAGEESLNDRSIGIELVNESRCREASPQATELEALGQSCQFLPFAGEQIDLLIYLARDILDRYPGIDPVDVVGHSDIAPDRKTDPGPLFPWKQLHDAGIGAWYDEALVKVWRNRFCAGAPDRQITRRALRAYGYDIDESDDELSYQKVIRAFQMHFLPERVSARADTETLAVLFALLEKYRPEALEALDLGLSSATIDSQTIQATDCRREPTSAYPDRAPSEATGFPF